MANNIWEYGREVAIAMEELLEINTVDFTATEMLALQRHWELGSPISYVAEKFVNARET